MEKFSKMKAVDLFKETGDEELYDDPHLKVIKYEDWSIIKQKDYVVCIPYLIETNQFVMRYEYIPTFKYVDGQEYHITLIGGGVETGEDHNTSIIRELEEEAGIVLREDFQLEPMKPMFISKSSSNKVHPYIIPLHERDYHEKIPTGDGTKHEAMAKSVKIDAKFLAGVVASDIVTEYMLIKLKEYMNLQV